MTDPSNSISPLFYFFYLPLQPILREDGGNFISKFLESHQQWRDGSVENIGAQLLNVDNLHWIDRKAMYIHLTWLEIAPDGDKLAVTAVLKYSKVISEDSDDREIDIIFHYRPLVYPPSGACIYEWLSRNDIDDILIAGGIQLGFVPQTGPSQCQLYGMFEEQWPLPVSRNMRNVLSISHAGIRWFVQPIAIPSHYSSYDDIIPYYREIANQFHNHGSRNGGCSFLETQI